MIYAKTKLIAIVGQTASGKSALAYKIAKGNNFEIICADSRTIYKGMDIGTAKPDKLWQKNVQHYCLDLIQPNQTYSVAQFKADANTAIDEINAKKKVPIIVGGSGLYIDSVVYDYDFLDDGNLRIDTNLTLEQMQQIAKSMSIKPTLQTLKNKQHLKRFIERGGISGNRSQARGLVLGIDVEIATLHQRISDRIDAMFDSGLVEEVQGLIKEFGPELPSFKTPGYRAVIDYLDGKLSLSEAKQSFIKADINLAKKQKTWFKRNKDINWVSDFDQAEQLISKYLIQ